MVEVLDFLMGYESYLRKQQVLVSSRRFQFSITDFSLVISPPSRIYFQGHSP
jgi:hypothetical protein